ncbi:MAG: FHA domain-containing protein, partial [Planctomycetota bacterium]
MPRFQLLVRELGKAPRLVPLTQAIVVGRSRRADLVIEDEEVGREQFRIGPEGSLVFVEGIGKTNRTTVEGTALDAGQRVTVVIGTTIKIGKSSVQVQAADTTAESPGGPGAGATMAAVRPGGASPPSGQEETGGFAGPMNTIEVKGPRGGPGGRSPTAPAADETGRTMNVPGGFRPGQKGPPSSTAGPPGAAAEADNSGQTMNVPGGFRPGQKPPSSSVEGLPTINVPGGFRLGGGAPAEPPRKPDP